MYFCVGGSVYVHTCIVMDYRFLVDHVIIWPSHVIRLNFYKPLRHCV